MKFRLEVHLTADGEVTPEEVETILDELLELEDVLEADIGGSLKARTVHVGMVVHAPDIDEAWACAATLLRTAIHAAGGGTHGWPVFHKRSGTAELVDA